MAVLKCKMCGGDLNIIEGASTAECEFCGSIQTIPKVDDEKKLTLFARANRLRAACEFDRAAGIYESIVADFPEEAEAYWGLVLCKYGIEYVDDPASGKKIPTCHRSSFESLMEDDNYEQALENADAVARKVYREEAKQIEELRKGIIEVSAKEEPYDIFICYKETAEDGNRTLDSVLAQDIYDALTDKGYRVFFSRITLEDKLGQEYEPYIFAALNSAKIMLAVGTDYEYFNAVWVKNEWSRFLQLMTKDKTKHLVPCFKGIDAYDMPKEFARLQAQDMGKVGAMQDLLRGVEKILPKVKPVQTAVQERGVVGGGSDTAPLLKRMFMFLEDGNWKAANEYCEKVLDIAPECAEAYLGKLMVELRIKKRNQLRDQKRAFDNNDNYQKIIRFADAALANELRNYLEASYTLQEKEVNRLAKIRESIEPVQMLISAGSCHTIGVKTDGTVETAGDYEDDMCNLSDWSDIIAVSAGDYHSVGLKADGTVVAAGDNDYGLCDLSDWSDIVAVSAEVYHTVGLKADGTVVSKGNDDDCSYDDLSSWKQIVAISATGGHVVGLKADGTAVATGFNDDGQCNVSKWKDIVGISAGRNHTVGLKADGTVVAVGSNKYGQSNVSGWTDIVAIGAGQYHTIGLKANGTVVVTNHTGDKSLYDGECDVSGWKNIVAVSAGDTYVAGLKADGTVVCDYAHGADNYGKCATHDWKLYQNITTLDEERAEAKQRMEEAKQRIAEEKHQAEERVAEEQKKAEAYAKQQAQWRSAGLCQHCGGQLKGLFGKKCVSCGKPKDY